nr:RHS repeat-associated core domain-containing protein [Burkholderia diffusa]
MHYNRHRYYDPNSGRFISKDPIGLAGGINVYQYADNPTGWIDPLGLAKRCGCPCGVEPHGNQPSPRPSGYQSHHIIQHRWAKANEIEGYNGFGKCSAFNKRTKGRSRVALAVSGRAGCVRPGKLGPLESIAAEVGIISAC